MLACPMCKKALRGVEMACGNCRTDVSLLVSYVNNLRSMSQGRATFTMQFDHYAEVPKAIAEEVQAKFA